MALLQIKKEERQQTKIRGWRGEQRGSEASEGNGEGGRRATQPLVEMSLSGTGTRRWREKVRVSHKSATALDIGSGLQVFASSLLFNKSM